MHSFRSSILRVILILKYREYYSIAEHLTDMNC